MSKNSFRPLRLFVVEPLATGGMIHYAYQLCTALAEEGADVTLVTEQGYEPAGMPHNFRVVPLLHLWPSYDQAPAGTIKRKIRRLWRGLRLVQQWANLTRYLLTEKPDLIQFGKINFPFEAFFLSQLRRRGLPLAQICHEFELREHGNGLWARLGGRLYQAVYAQFAIIFLHGQFNRDRFAALFKFPNNAGATLPVYPQLWAIDHGNETIFQSQHGGPAASQKLSQQYQLPYREPVILLFGNLTPSKGLSTLLSAFALVRAQIEARLVVAGYPTKHTDMAGLRQLAAELGIEEWVTWDCRYIPAGEVGPLMELATVAVYPYHSSTQSGALQVAYAFGRPVVATQVGGLPEAVEDGQSGLLVPAQDPAALAQAILAIVTNPTRAAAMGQYARHLSENRFAWRPIARQILAVYEQFLS